MNTLESMIAVYSIDKPAWLLKIGRRPFTQIGSMSQKSKKSASVRGAKTRATDAPDNASHTASRAEYSEPRSERDPGF